MSGAANRCSPGPHLSSSLPSVQLLHLLPRLRSRTRRSGTVPKLQATGFSLVPRASRGSRRQDCVDCKPPRPSTVLPLHRAQFRDFTTRIESIGARDANAEVQEDGRSAFPSGKPLAGKWSSTRDGK